ncbi:hypothetical protein M2119_000684 [Aurantimicrobium minutum]|uniref:hypothetical protein n=1 Tax=Aurantimicrobium minutum TaxID=708131 RepID=UPI002475CB21|nr:hypothetical protein [Aurantimicrobium minutum]MDH6532447.1 hypothetical protein [Aurantimicrobium minutum]
MGESTFRIDNQETEEERRLGHLMLQEAKDRAKPLIESWITYSSPDEESHLRSVDRLTPYNPLSYQLRTFLNVAIDSIRTTLRYVEVTNEIPMVAHYSLIRTSVEASSYGIWLLSAGRKEKQAWLSLRLSYENTQELDGLEKVFLQASMPAPDREPIKQRLIELQQNLKAYRTHDITQRSTTTDVIANADKSFGKRKHETSGLQVWKACSGPAHGNGAVITALLEREPIGSESEYGQTFLMTSRLTVTGMFLLVAIENAERLLELLGQQGRKNIPNFS